MFFRNLTLFRFDPQEAPSAELLEQVLSEHLLRDCGPLELSVSGFVPPFGANITYDCQSPALGNLVVFTVAGQQKMLPPGAIAEAVQKRTQAITEAEHRPVTSRERKRIRGEVIDQLLPRALCKPWRTAGYLDLASGWVVLDTASRSMAELMLNQLRDALGSFPATPLAPYDPPRVKLTGWLYETGNGEQLPQGLAAVDECQLERVDGNERWSGRHLAEIGSGEVMALLRAGASVSRLGLTLNDRISFTLDEHLVVRKLKLFDVVTDPLDRIDAEDAAAESIAGFTICAAEIHTLLGCLERCFNIPRPSAF